MCSSDLGISNDVVQFGEGILPAYVSLGRHGYDLIITVNYPETEQSADTLRIYSYFDEQGTTSATINTIAFADGTTWNYDYVRDHWNSVPDASGGITLDGDNSNNYIYGS